MRSSHVLRLLDREFSSTASFGHTPVMLWGPPGIGKSRIVAHVAAAHGAPLVDVRLSQMEPTDLRGIPFRNGARVEWSVPALLPEAGRHGTRGILFLDEITSAPPTVTAAAYQLILDRRLGEYVLPEGWTVFAAGNRYGDRGVTYVMPAPLANRFTHYELEPHLDDWVAWAQDADIDERIIAFLRFRPDLLFDFDPARNAVAFPSPRSWEFAHRALQKFSDDPDLLLPSLEGCVGPAAAVELSAFIEHMTELPDVDAILQGRCHDVPVSLDLKYGVAAAVVRRALQSRAQRDASHLLANALRYAKAFPEREFGVMLVADLQRGIGKPLVSMPEFREWATSVSDLVLFDLGNERA